MGIRKNIVLNVIKTLLSVLFPLITFPYISRILDVENLGKINFASSFVSYFILLAGLGIISYSLREGSKIKDNKEEFDNFSNEIFTLNIFSSIIAYLCFILTYCTVGKLHSYTEILMIYSINIVLTSFTLDWLFTLFEDFAYITFRNSIIQILSIIFMFLFVKSESDVYIYVAITVIANIFNSIISFLYSRKYCNLKVVINRKILKRIKPVLILFSTKIAITLYVNIDLTIIGFTMTNWDVGIYSVATKIYTIVKNILNAIIMVVLPRLAYYKGNDKSDDYKKLLFRLMDEEIILIIPAIFGLIFLSTNIILLISGVNYIEASPVLKILSLAIIFSSLAIVIDQGILIIFNDEKYLLKMTVISAVVNVLLNIILIPSYGIIAAAWTTLISQSYIFFAGLLRSKKFVKLKFNSKNTFQSFVASTGMGIILYSLQLTSISSSILLILSTILGFSVYVIIMLILKNEIIFSYYQKINSILRNVIVNFKK